MAKVRNILLIGITGSGKSTLANILGETDEFKEGDGDGSTTKELKTKEFAHKENKYKVVDTIGIGDTNMPYKEIMIELSKACHAIEGGLYQIFFIVGKKFKDEEVKAYNLLREVFFDEDIVNYTTIVRTGFTGFASEKKCKENKDDLKNSNPKLAELVRTCNGLIYVDNPPAEDHYVDLAPDIRKKSREKLLKHLENDCGNYRPVNLVKLNERIGAYMTEVDELKQKLDELKRMSEEEKAKSEEEKERNRKIQEETQKRMAELETKLQAQTEQQLKRGFLRGCKPS